MLLKEKIFLSKQNTGKGTEESFTVALHTYILLRRKNIGITLKVTTFINLVKYSCDSVF